MKRLTTWTDYCFMPGMGVRVEASIRRRVIDSRVDPREPLESGEVCFARYNALGKFERIAASKYQRGTTFKRQRIGRCAVGLQAMPAGKG
jgi:hypothetical protein